MDKPKLGLKLSLRKSKKNLLKNASLWWGKINALATIVLALLGVILAINGNRLSKASYELSKNDTAQQTQISRLNEILSTQKIQIDTLVAIINELRKIKETSENNIAQISEQTKLISNNAQPTFKIIDYNPNLNDRNNFEVNLYIKNIGLRQASNLNCSAILLKYNTSKVISHEFFKNGKEASFPVNLSPSDEINYFFITNSTIKQADINNSITVLRFIYLDNALNRTDTTTLFLKNNFSSESPIMYENIGGPLKATVQKYLKAKRI